MNRVKQVWRIGRTLLEGGPVPLRVARTAVRQYGAVQRTWELQALLCDVRRLRPRVVVEIGTHRGGTFAAFAAVAHPRARLVSIDMPDDGFGTTDEDVARLRAMLRPGQSMTAIRGDSHDAATRDRLLDALAGAPVDVLWIDGDHSAAGVRQDLAMYAPLVRDGGLVALHDIHRNPRHTRSQVHDVWADLKHRHPHREYIDQDQPGGGMGIGVLHAPLALGVLDAAETTEVAGCRLAFWREGHGPPVIFIQGVGVHGRGWMPQVDDLRSDYECLVFDNRGMGASQPLGGPLTVERMAADTLAIMDGAGWPSAHVVGHSMGGPIALEMALARPERVRSLALLCTVARGRDATRLTGRLLWRGLRSRIGTRRMRRRAFLEIIMPSAALRGMNRDALAAHLEPLFGHDLADQPPITMPQLSALRAYDATDRLPRLAGIHTLVMSAAHDPIAAPRYGRALAAGIRDARYIEFTDASHGLPLSHPARVNELLRGHLREAARATQPAIPPLGAEPQG